MLVFISGTFPFKITQLFPFVKKCQVYTLQLDPHTGLLDEKDLVQRLQKIQSLKPGESNLGKRRLLQTNRAVVVATGGPRVGH